MTNWKKMNCLGERIKQKEIELDSIKEKVSKCNQELETELVGQKAIMRLVPGNKDLECRQLNNKQFIAERQLFFLNEELKKEFPQHVDNYHYEFNHTITRIPRQPNDKCVIL